MKDYDRLRKLSTEMATLSSILALIGWDQETFMPSGSIAVRSNQQALLASLIHKKQTSKAFSSSLEKFISLSTGELKKTELSLHQKGALVQWRKTYLREKKLPSSFVKTFTQITSEALPIWVKARKENTFSSFAPYLEKIISLNRQKAKILGYKDHPYDALLDLYEPDMTVQTLTPLFSKLQTGLTALLQKIEKKPLMDTTCIKKEFSTDTQMKFGQFLFDTLGLDRSHSRLDQSAHPFSVGIHPLDTRITTRISSSDLLSNIFSVIHEAGHALYEMGLPLEHYGTPICEACSTAMHESQSRFWETLIGKSLPFWIYLYPFLQKFFPDQLKGISVEEFYQALHLVSPSFIRVEADELTYCLHIILRFNLEKALIEGSLSVKDLPKAWNEQIKTLLGITPPSDTEGCLQDIHWSMGAFGYFPTYALGNLYAAQFFQSFSKQTPGWGKKIETGDFTPIKSWLKENIHQKGKLYSPKELVIQITKEPLKEKPYLDYLETKYSNLYHL